MIDELLKESATGLSDLTAIAFGRGPGGFTGVRLAASVTQGLAFGAGLPVVPISDLAAVALRALDLDSTASEVLVCNDARMREVYWAFFRRSDEGRPVLLDTERVGPIGSIVGAQSVDLGAGSGFRVFPELASRVRCSHPSLLPRALEIAMLATDAPRLSAEE